MASAPNSESLLVIIELCIFLFTFNLLKYLSASVTDIKIVQNIRRAMNKFEKSDSSLIL